MAFFCAIAPEGLGFVRLCLVTRQLVNVSPTTNIGLMNDTLSSINRSAGHTAAPADVSKPHEPIFCGSEKMFRKRHFHLGEERAFSLAVFFRFDMRRAKLSFVCFFFFFFIPVIILALLWDLALPSSSNSDRSGVT